MAASGAIWVRAAPGGALDDAEVGRRVARVGARLDRLDARQRRRLALDAREEDVDRRGRAADAHQHALGVVQDLAGKIELAGQAPHGRPESDALDAAAHADLDRAIRSLASAGSRHAAVPQQDAVVAGFGDHERAAEAATP